MKKRDFKKELISPNYRVDNNMMRKYVREMFITKKMIEQEIADVEELIIARYERREIITMEDGKSSVSCPLKPSDSAPP